MALDEEVAAKLVSYPFIKALAEAFENTDDYVDIYAVGDDRPFFVLDAYGTDMDKLEQGLAQVFTLREQSSCK